MTRKDTPPLQTNGTAMTTETQKGPASQNISHRIQRLSGKDLEIGIGARLILEPMGSDRKILSEFVGMVRDKGIITLLPTKSGDREFFVSDALLTVKYIQSGHNVSAFRTIVLGVNTKPLPLLFLQIPDAVESLNLRKSDRVHCFLPTTAYVDGQEHAGLIIDLSAGGCRLVIETKPGAKPPEIAAEAEIVTNFQLFDKDSQIFAQGMVRTAEAGANATIVGVQFKDLGQDIQDNIQNYVRTISRYLMD